MNTPITFGVRSWTAALIFSAGSNLAFAQLNCPGLREEQLSEVAAEQTSLKKPATSTSLMAFDVRGAADFVAIGAKLLAPGGNAANEKSGTRSAATERKAQSRRVQPNLLTTLLPSSAGAPENSALCSRDDEATPVRIAVLRAAGTAPAKIADVDSAFPATLSSAVLEKFGPWETPVETPKQQPADRTPEPLATSDI